MSQYLFSQFRVNEFETLHRELSKVFDIQQAELQSIYEIMRTEFEIDGSASKNVLPRSIFRSDNPNFQKRYDEALLVGVDLPSILEKDNGILEKKTIVILAQDPLRKGSKRIEEIGVGTPYSLHEKRCREKGISSNYFDLIKVLLDEGYRVYLTDIYKIWVSQPDKDRCISLSKQDENHFIQILKAELEILAPLTIITWGQKASDAVESLNLDVRHLKFPHPSNAANGTWLKIIGKSPTQENKIEFWRQKVSDYLASVNLNRHDSSG